MYLKITHIVLLFSFSFGFSQEQKFKTQEINIPSEKVIVNGTILSPDNHKDLPLVIIIPGSGANDRDGNQVATKVNYLKYLAEGLAQHKIATYRYDKSAIALLKKEGFKEEDVDFDDFVNDAIAVVNYFKDKEQFSKIVVAGHSQGSLVGMLASKQRADAFISISGSGRQIDEVLIEQVVKQSPIFEKDLIKTFDSLRLGKIDEDFNPLLVSILRKSLQPFWISWVKYNPQKEIKKLKIPILIINGTRDIQVQVSEAELLHKANSKSELLIIEDMNHVLKEVKTDDLSENIATYSNTALAIKKELVKEIAKFVTQIE